MRFSQSIKSSSHSIPSPNGAFIATILPSKFVLRKTSSLRVWRTYTIPTDLHSNVQWFSWSPSSNRVLICAGDLIRIFCIRQIEQLSTISNPTSGIVKITSVSFGEDGNEVCVFSDFGLKLTIFNLSAPETIVEINSPKFYSGNTGRGFAVRPDRCQCAILTRTGGKDVISIHGKPRTEILRSWHPETLDAQAIQWSPDGRWIAVVESAAHGRKICLYTADGCLFRAWNGPKPRSDEERDLTAGAGIKMIDWNPTGNLIVVGDQSPNISLLSGPIFSEVLRLSHTATVKPVKGIQIWQEQVLVSSSGKLERLFTECNQPICPPSAGTSPTADANAKSGTNLLSFDASGTLVVSRCESMPTAVWIWDIAGKVLKTVIILHAPVARATWHPSANELLMIRCEGDDSRGLAHLWESSWDAPIIVDFGTQLPEGKIIGKAVVRWLVSSRRTALESPRQSIDRPSLLEPDDRSVAAGTSPALFFSDTQDCILAVTTDVLEEVVPWQITSPKMAESYAQREESPLNLVEASESKYYGGVANPWLDDTTKMSSAEEIDSTFRFRKFAGS